MTIKVKKDINFYKQVEGTQEWRPDLYFCFKDPYTNTNSILFVKYIDIILLLLFELSAPFLRMDNSRQWK